MTETFETQNSEQNKNIQEDTAQPIVAEQPAIVEEENPNEAHWRKFREQRKEERKQLAEKERELQKKKEEAEALKKALEAVVTPSYPQQQAQAQYYTQPEENEEKRILDKVNALLEQREKEREQRRAQEEHAQYPQRLQRNYSDFNQVVSTENLDYLEYHYPEVAKPLAMLPDSYEKWEGIYKAAKRFIPQDKEKDMKKMEKNLAKPVAMSRPGMTSTSEQAPHIALTDEQRAKNWERMRKMMKGV